MKIGVDSSRAFKDKKTGVEWYAYNVINEIIKIDDKNQFILYCDDNFRSPTPYRGLDSLVKILRWPFKFLWTQGRLSLEMLLHRSDVLFVPASAMPIIHPKNTVAVIHDVGFMKYPKAYGKLQRIYLKWSTKFAVKHAKKIITISEFSKQEIVKYFGADDTTRLRHFLRTRLRQVEEGYSGQSKIFVTPLAYDKEKYCIISDKEKIKNVLNKYNIKAPYIFYVGRLEKKKNINGIIEAFAKTTSPNPLLGKEGANTYKLVLAGSKGYGWEEAEELIKKYNLQDEIILTGYVADEYLPYLYNGADLFLFPSLYEGFGMPILEAFACGTPVITSNTTSCLEVGGEAAIYVNPENYEEIATAISKVLDDNALRGALRGRGLDRVKDFSWEKCGKETLKILMD